MASNPDQLTPAEQALLARYVTNTQGPVFALTNLPEVVKGALFSRYSRSTLGLRRLLLKEFIQEGEAQLAEINQEPAEGAVQSAERSRQALEKAQAFYDRILDGYGDDSIGELGGAHLALEEVSMIATKAIEDARLGGSPLEKSTRYVSFAEKVNGDYRFYKEPRLMASPHQERYLAANRALFDGYAAMLEPMCAHLRGRVAREEGISDAAYGRAVKARAFDALRGLLPASTLTNMGIFGNGRFFESLLLRLELAPLAELNMVATQARLELEKVIPSFVRRAQPGHRHYTGFKRYAEACELLGSSTAATAAPALSRPATDVALVDYDPDAEARILAAWLYPYSQSSLSDLREWAKGLNERDVDRLFQQMGHQRENRRHKPGRATETVFYTFDLTGDFGMYRDLHRHRTLTQSRQLLSPHHGYVMPEEVEEAGLGDRFRQLMDQAAEAYQAIAQDFPLEAQYVTPMACRVRWQMHINLRALAWLVELRSQPQGHPAYRAMAQQMFQRVKEVHPRLAHLIKFVDMKDYPLGRLDAEQKLEEKRQEQARP